MKRFYFLFICFFCTQVFADSKVENLSSTFLQNYIWKIQNSDQKILTFKNTRVNINVGCNNMSTNFSIVDGKIITHLLISTMMFCDEKSAQEEKNMADFFNQQKLSVNFINRDLESPVLKLTNENGKSYEIYGKMTNEAKYKSEGETIFLEIAAQTKPCTGVMPQECLQVRQITYDNGIQKSVGDWEYFYSNIEGYEHSKDYEVILRIKRYKVPNPAADQGSFVYVRDMVVSQKTVEE